MFFLLLLLLLSCAHVQARCAHISLPSFEANGEDADLHANVENVLP